jgi:exonuclease III
MEAAGGGLQPTIASFGKGPATIDHIYVSESLADGLRSAEVVRDAGFYSDGPEMPGRWVHSDHLPVVAEIELPAI